MTHPSHQHPIHAAPHHTEQSLEHHTAHHTEHKEAHSHEHETSSTLKHHAKPHTPPAMTQEEKLAKTARTNKVRLVVDLFMIIAFFILFFTSVFKMPFPVSWYDYLQDKGVFEALSFSFLSYLHDIAGIVFIVCLVIHLYLNWKRLTWLIKAALK